VGVGAGSKALTGLAGVHYVAFQLSSRLHAVGLTGPGVKGVDLLATNAESGSSITIQVKTATNAHVNVQTPTDHWKWHVGKILAEGHRHRHFFVAFVDLRGGAPDAYDVPWTPDVFILPSVQLDRYLRGFPEKKPRDFWLVILPKDAHKYKNRWDYIEDALA
jgi:hypothetical protein